MNRTGKHRLFMSIGLSLLLIIQMVAFVVFKGRDNYVLWTMFGLIVLLSIVAVAINYFNLRELRQRVASLNSEYKEVYIDAQEAIGYSTLSKPMKKEVEAAVLEIFEHAALDGRSVEEVIGGDLEAFINGFVDAAGGQYSILYLFSYSSVLFFSYLLLMKVYKVIRMGFQWSNIQTETLDVGIVGSYALIAFIFFPWLMLTLKKSSIERWEGSKKLLLMMPFVIPVGLLGVLIGIDNEGIRAILDQPLPLLASPFRVFIFVVILLGSVALLQYSRRKHVEESRKI